MREAQDGLDEDWNDILEEEAGGKSLLFFTVDHKLKMIDLRYNRFSPIVLRSKSYLETVLIFAWKEAVEKRPFVTDEAKTLSKDAPQIKQKNSLMSLLLNPLHITNPTAQQLKFCSQYFPE